MRLTVRRKPVQKAGRGRNLAAGEPATAWGRTPVRYRAAEDRQEFSHKEREILRLTACEGLTPREIATVTRTSANLVRVRLAHARDKLRRRLASLEPADGPPRIATVAPFDQRIPVDRR